MQILIIAIGIGTAWLLADNEGWLIVAAIIATFGAGATCRIVADAAQQAGLRPTLSAFPPVPLAIHTASVISLLALAIAGFILP